MKRYACVHGHFYQPPRENPWTGAVERQISAGRDHDWNARVARECYVPNGEARVMDGKGRIIDLVDNYAWMSFNFGPTLLAWLESAHPHAYRGLLQADRESASRLGGHGNALAQPFHHAILPLSDPRDRLTEIRWGLADFERRFGRKAEGLWLPECAADDATLQDVAAEGVKFVILEPHQGMEVLAAGGEKWKPASEALVPGLPYRWRGARGAALAVFFYDGALSRAIAFERAMTDSRSFAKRILGRILPTAEDGLCLIATDGESYGHHESFAEMGLAHMLRYALPEMKIEPVNLGWYLARNPPRREVRLKPGGTSWSCSHGVERWRDDCGCGAAEGRHQRWRKPLREALEGLRSRLAALYEEKSKGLMPDPWAARDAYIAAVLDRSEESLSRFLAAHAPGAEGEVARSRALRLLEMQRHSLMMFTSCGWFFDELSRLEPVQVLLYAARALELARSFGDDFEPEFVDELARAPSNDPAYGDGAGVWRALVRPRVHTPEHVAAHYAVSLLFEDEPPAEVQTRRARCDRFTRRVEGGVTVAAGRAEFAELTTRERWARSFFAAVLPGQRVQAFVCGPDLPDATFEAMIADAARGDHTCPLPSGRHFLLRDLRPDEREKVLRLVLKRRLSRWEAGARESLDDILPIVENFRGLGIPLPPGLGEETHLVLSHVLAHVAARFAEGDAGALDEFRSTLSRGRAAGLENVGAVAEIPWAQGVSRVLDVLERDFADARLRELTDAVELAGLAGLSDWRGPAQTRYFRLWKSRGAGSPLAAEAASVLGIAT